LRPKAYGAWLIHNDTMLHKDPISLFVTLSSLNATVGTQGQANYGAANFFLDNLALLRRSLNLSALSIQLGVIAEVGYVNYNKVYIFFFFFFFMCVIFFFHLFGSRLLVRTCLHLVSTQ
jgi:hypothetical protein